jgi:predicted ATPase
MKEKLIIDNFAGMKHIELDINNINLLIGPQATGKSVCAKLLYFFKYFIYEMLNAAERGKSIKDFNNSIMGRFTRYFPMECLDRREYKIDYILNINQCIK